MDRGERTVNRPMAYMVWYKSDKGWKSDFGLSKEDVQKLMDSLPPNVRMTMNVVGYFTQ